MARGGAARCAPADRGQLRGHRSMQATDAGGGSPHRIDVVGADQRASGARRGRLTFVNTSCLNRGTVQEVAASIGICCRGSQLRRREFVHAASPHSLGELRLDRPPSERYCKPASRIAVRRARQPCRSPSEEYFECRLASFPGTLAAERLVDLLKPWRATTVTDHVGSKSRTFVVPGNGEAR